jgi:alkanesulfonate monooxygenase SsuD/methylene tetrahydromethanopterin reductase-like flavin-dependent oxidoreductase (luciferase family)
LFRLAGQLYIRGAVDEVGTSIVPAFTRHPIALLSQVASLEALAPGPLRLGVGTGNLVVTAATLGAPVAQPLARMREYVGILRAGLEMER